MNSASRVGRLGLTMVVPLVIALAPLGGLQTERASASSVNGVVVAWGGDYGGVTDVPAGLSGAWSSFAFVLPAWMVSGALGCVCWFG